MYRHNALSIKETSKKRFISKQDKDTYKSIEDECISLDDSYSKEEIDNKIMNRLSNSEVKLDIDSQSYPYMIDDIEDGYFSNIEIFGNTERDVSIKRVHTKIKYGDLDITTGEEITSERVVISSDYIQVSPGDYVTFYACVDTSWTPNLQDVYIFMYNKNEKYVSSTDIVKSFMIPDNVYYIKVKPTAGNISISYHSFLVIKTDNKSLLSIGDKKFDGTHVVKIEHKSRNLFNINEVKNLYNDYYIDGKIILRTTSTQEYRKYLDHAIKLKPKTKYTLVSKFEKNEYFKYPEVLVFRQVDAENKILNGGWTTFNSSSKVSGDIIYNTFTVTDDNAPYTRIRFDNNGTTEEGKESVISYSDIMLYEGEFDPNLEYEDYEERAIEINIPSQLHKIGDIEDRLYIKDEKIIVEKNIKERCLSAYNSNWELNNIISEYNNECAIFELNYASNPDLLVKYGTQILCDMFLTDDISNGVECIYNTETSIVLQLKKSRLSNESLFGFMEWLRENPINILYVYPETEVIEIDNIALPLIPTFKGCNTIDNSSNVNPSKFKVTLPISIGASMSRNISAISALSDELHDIKNIVKKSAFTLDFESRIHNLESNGEIIDGLEIQGKTLRACHDTDLYTLNETFTDNVTVQNSIFCNLIPGDSSSIDISNGIITVTKNQIDNPEYTNLFIRRDNLHIKPDTLYTYIIEVLENTMVSNSNVTTSNSVEMIRTGNTYNSESGLPNMTVFAKTWGAVICVDEKTGIYKQLMRTRPEKELNTMTADMIGDRVFITKYVTGTVKFRIWLLEGDHMDSDISDITPTLTSVANNSSLKLSTTGKNLIDFKNIHYIYPSNNVNIPYNIYGRTLILGDGYNNLPEYTHVQYLVYLEKNKFYDVRFESDVNKTLEVKYLGKNNKGINVHNSTITSNTGGKIQALCGDGLYRISLYANKEEVCNKATFTDIGVYEIHDNYSYSYEDYKNDNVEINLSKYDIVDGLKSLPDGTCDRIYKRNGRYCIEQNIGSIVLEQSDINNAFLYSTHSTYVQIGIALSRIPNMLDIKKERNIYVLSTIFNTSTSPTNRQGTVIIFVTHSSTNELTLYFRLPPYLIGELTLDKAKEFLSLKQPTIYYPLEKPIITEIQEDLDLRLYKGINRLEVNEGYVSPVLKISKSGALQNTVQNLLCEIRNLSTTELSVAKLTLDSIYTGDVTNYMIDISRSVYNEEVNYKYDNELFELLYNLINSGKSTYDLTDMEEKIDFFCIINKLSYEMCGILFEMMYLQQDII